MALSTPLTERKSVIEVAPVAPFSEPSEESVEAIDLALETDVLDEATMAEVAVEPTPTRGRVRPPADPATFEAIVKRYHGKVFQLVYRYLGDYEEACDITQDTFVRAYSAWTEFRGDSQIYTWLYRIAINLCHNQQKKLQRRRRVEPVSLDVSFMDDQSDTWSERPIADERPLPLQVLESGELRVRLREALRELPDNYRTVIVLRDIEGLTYEEIARVTDSTLEAIKSRLFRARNAVRRLMEPYLLAEGGGTPTV